MPKAEPSHNRQAPVSCRPGRESILHMAKLRDVALLCLASAGALQAQHRYPLKYVGPVEARSTEAISTPFPVLRQLPNGQLHVIDTVAKRSFTLDASMNIVVSSQDSTPRGVYRGATQSDSAPLLRMNTQTNAIETVARIRVPVSRMKLDTLGSGEMRWRATFEVLPTIDEWTSLPDGTVAVVRGADYHIDWYRPDGTTFATKPMQIDWRRMTDAEKKQRVDDTRTAYEANNSDQAPGTADVSVEFAQPNTLPDYLPPVFVGGVKSDPIGNVWIAPSSSSYAGWAGFLYDVVNRRGEIMERVRLPRGRVIAGFGENGTVYMVSMEPGGMYLERTRRQ
jgi:hypothetical protein